MFIGCCGFPRGMKEYFRTFRVVEVQKTFYKPPKVETARKWRKNAPEDFEFCVKAWQLITHPPTSPTYAKAGIKIEDKDRYGYFKPTNEVFHAWEKTKEICEILDTKIVLFQTPPSFEQEKENISNLKEFFSSISGFRFAWEPRGRWDPDVLRETCAELNLIHCVDPFLSSQVYGNIAYFRLHGIGSYRYRYNEEDLEKLKEMCKGKKIIYCLFNNVHMYEDALRFKEMMKNGKTRD
ncbi:MAG: DUF72 domain-containing protein [Candidatus Syntropharchaeia archaeon]